jgi:DUF2075 family protein
MKREYYSDSIAAFLSANPNEILGQLSRSSDFAVEPNQLDAWLGEVNILQSVLKPFEGTIYFEYSIPRMGQRIDAVLLIGPVLFILEFKVGEKDFALHAVDQVWDYALDLKNFHETSHSAFIAPILVATKARSPKPIIPEIPKSDRLFRPFKSTVEMLGNVIKMVLDRTEGPNLERTRWESGRYCPTPTIIEAALALYNHHSVEEISRRDASATNLSQTSNLISSIIHSSREKSHKAICFVTGVPGAGKTLVGLNIATTEIEKANEIGSIFLSGNGPLVAILREALVRDKVQREKDRGRKITKGGAKREVKAIVQNVHHFRDESLVDPNSPPKEHVALFDEAQRAWNVKQTAGFMRQKKGIPDFNKSEPEFLISYLDRHPDWAVIVCLVGGGQEINTGEAGISEWIASLTRSFPDWHIYVSSRLTDSEYGAGEILSKLVERPNVMYRDELHLGVSMRSFRAEDVSLLVKQLLDLSSQQAQKTFEKVRTKYPIVITRELSTAKQWLKSQAQGSERFGMVASSQAYRLKAHGIDVRPKINPIHWFLNGKEDVRSSYQLEDVATEFDVQGLELDWACVTWDADFRYSETGWKHWSFRGSRWNHIKKSERQNYLKNAYRVLLTRARQGMVIVVPPGDSEDKTRNPASYNPTFEYLKEVGFSVI